MPLPPDGHGARKLYCRDWSHQVIVFANARVEIPTVKVRDQSD